MRFKQPDRKKAQSLFEAAKKDLEFTSTLPPSEASASTIIRNIYEAFRMLGEALLVADGKEAEGHDEMIKELLKLKVKTTRPIMVIDNLRQLRHNINYYGYRPSKAEAEDAISIAKACFVPLLEGVKTRVR